MSPAEDKDCTPRWGVQEHGREGTGWHSAGGGRNRRLEPPLGHQATHLWKHHLSLRGKGCLRNKQQHTGESMTGGHHDWRGKPSYTRRGSERQRGKTVTQDSTARRGPGVQSGFLPLPSQPGKANSLHWITTERTDRAAMQRAIKNCGKEQQNSLWRKQSRKKNVTTEVDKVKIITQNSSDFFFF